MARLTIEQVKAPDFSASSEMMARANQSFNSGMESAKGILNKYNEGQQAKADQSLLGALAGLDSEEALTNFLSTTDLGSMNLSEGMRENILGARGVILGNDSTRQGTLNARDSNSRANAGEGRTAAEYADGVSARDELRGLTGAAVAAYTEGQQYGNGAAPTNGSTREILAKTIMAEAGNQDYEGMIGVGAVIRNRADNGNYGGNTIDGVIMKRGQFSAWNSVTGYAGGEQGQDMANMQPSDSAYKAADAVLSGQYTDNTGGATHYYNPDVSTPAWGAGKNPGSGNGWTRIGGHIFGNPDGPPAPGSGVRGPIDGNAPITSNTGASGPAGAAYANALIASTYLTPDQAKGMLDDQFANQAAGQTLIDSAEAKRVAEGSAASILAGINDPNSLTPGSASTTAQQEAARRNLPASAILGVAGDTVDAASGNLASVLAPSVIPDARTSAAAELAVADVARQQSQNPDAKAFETANAFSTSESSPGTTIFNSIPNAESNSALSPANLDKAINDFAEANNLDRSEVATVYQAVGQENSELMGQLLTALPDSDLDRSLKNMHKFLFNDQARAAYDDGVLNSVAATDQIQKNQGELLSMRTGVAKLRLGSPERQKAEAQLAKMEFIDRAMNQPQKTKNNLANYMQIEPYELLILTQKEKGDMESTINNDNSLSEEQKLLLIVGLRL